MLIPRRILKRLSVRQLREAIKLKAQLEKVERLEHERDQHLSAIKKLDREIAKLSDGNDRADAPGKRRRRKMSADTRRKMSEAAKRRWAGSGSTKGAAPAGRKRTLSPETRAKMAEAARSRWAKVKAKKAPEV
jgi:hypothetical protein